MTFVDIKKRIEDDLITVKKKNLKTKSIYISFDILQVLISNSFGFMLEKDILKIQCTGKHTIYSIPTFVLGDRNIKNHIDISIEL